MSLDNVHSFD